MSFDPDIESIATLLAPLPVTWGFCGGWSIDLFLNHITRIHKDIDVAILRPDQRLVFAYLHQQGWTLELAMKGNLFPLQADEFLVPPAYTIWCRNLKYMPNFLEISLTEVEGDQYQFRHNTAIQHPLAEAFILTLSGLPILAPEINLLSKSRDLSISKNQTDFHSALPLLSERQRQWLAQAIYTLSPDHEWLKELTA